MGEPRDTICRPPRGAQLSQEGHRLASSPPAARENSPSHAPYFFRKGWTVEDERAHRVARMFTAIDKSLPGSKRTMHGAFGRSAWKWNGQPYTCDPSRRMHLAEGTLRHLYYNRWLPGGRTVAALKRRWWSGNQKVSPSQVLELCELCLAPGTVSFSAAYRKLPAKAAKEAGFRYAIPARLRAALAALLAHRRRERVLERTARKYLEVLET